MLKKLKVYLWNKWRIFSLKILQKKILQNLQTKSQIEQFQYPSNSATFKDYERCAQQMELSNQDIEKIIKENE